MSIANISLYGIPARVEYTYYKGCPATLEQPAEDENFRISSVRIGGVECFVLFTDEQFDDICDELRAHREGEECEAADRARDEAQLERWIKRAA